jgi:hypothetical protein
MRQDCSAKFSNSFNTEEEWDGTGRYAHDRITNAVLYRLSYRGWIQAALISAAPSAPPRDASAFR